MGFEKWYRHTGLDTPSSSILEFFGFTMNVEDGTRLRAHTVTEYKKIDDNTYVKEKRPIGFYSEKNGLKDCSLERSYVSETNKEIEERFIQRLYKEGKEPTSDYFIWNTRCPCKSVNAFAPQSMASIAWPILFAVIAALAMLAIAAQGFYEFYIADQAGLTTGPAIGKILLAILGGIVVVPVVFAFFQVLFEDKPLAKRSKEEQERVRKEYLDSLGKGFSKEVGDILREYAIANGYDRITDTSINKFSFALVFLAIIGVLVLLWFEVITVRVFRVTDVMVEGDTGYRITYEYDHTGNLVEMAYYDSEGQMTECIRYEHNSLGVLENSAAYTVDGEELNQVSRSEYSDTFSGYTQIERIINMSHEEIGKITNYYSFSNLLKERCVYECGELVKRTACEYDKKKLVKQTEYGYDGDEEYVISVSVYSYDDKGNQTLCEVYRDDLLVSSTASKYEKKTLVQQTYCEYNESGEEILTKTTAYTYDGDKLERITEYLGEEMIGYQVVECDENGNILQIVGYDADDQQLGNSTSYVYEEFRMWQPRANRLQRERGEDLVIIDKGWF